MKSTPRSNRSSTDANCPPYDESDRLKTAKPPAPEPSTTSTAAAAAGSSTTTTSRRAQPVRQTRINPQRSATLNRSNNPLSSSNAPAPEQPINILPGVTHFADAISALPRELVRHFTLLKEVDAKIFAPEETLFQLLDDALNTPVPDIPRQQNTDASNSAVANAHRHANASIFGLFQPPPMDPPEVFDPANLPRRKLFHETAMKIQELLVSLEEKNHVIATANDVLNKQLARIEEIWPHLEAEFSDEAKWGSTTHWAYIDNRQQQKANEKQAERSRRDGAAALSAAAEKLAEDAASRGSGKQGAGKKGGAGKNAGNDDTDKNQDSAGTGKKGAGAKSRKPLPDSQPVGLGISNAGSGTTASKRRKTENAKSNGGTPTERAMSTVYGSGAKQRTTSPRETPAPEGGTGKKRKALPTASNQTKKR